MHEKMELVGELLVCASLVMIMATTLFLVLCVAAAGLVWLGVTILGLFGLMPECL